MHVVIKFVEFVTAVTALLERKRDRESEGVASSTTPLSSRSKHLTKQRYYSLHYWTRQQWTQLVEWRGARVVTMRSRRRRRR